MLRRKLFDWRQSLEDYIFIDLCAGSGAMGFEALSRGARQLYVNDLSKPSFLTLTQNKENLLSRFDFSEQEVFVGQSKASEWIERHRGTLAENAENIIIYLDPPYENHALYFEVIELLKLKKYKGEIWIESDQFKGPSMNMITGVLYSVIKKIEQGDHFVVVGKLY
jgi:16S rRNA (guanine966-N2)-methyltransferase